MQLKTISITLIILILAVTLTVVAQNTTTNTTTNTTVTIPGSNTTNGTVSSPTLAGPNRPGTNQTLLPLDFMRIPAAVTGAGVAWDPSALKFTWNNIVQNADFCRQSTQCLLTAAGDETKDGQPATFFQSASDSGRSKCLNDGQYVLDHLCQNGQWSSRVAQIFLHLTSLSEAANPDDYSVTCSNPESVFNDIEYVTSTGVRVRTLIGEQCSPSNSINQHPCINNACVARYENGIALGTSLNQPINSLNSFLVSLNLSATFCDNVQGTDYAECSPGTLAQERVYYNPYTESVIFLQNDQLPTIDVTIAYDNIIKPRYDELVSYANNNINDPQLEKSYFNRPQSFEHISLTRIGGKEIFGFKSEQQTQFRYDYTGITYENIDLGQNACTGFIKLFDDHAYCEQQPTPGKIFVIGQSSAGNRTLSRAWIDMTAKVRP